MMLKHKMSIISASGRPTAKLNPFLESSFGGHFTVADAVLVEATNAGQKIGTVHGRINLFFKRINDQLLLVSTCHWCSHWIKKIIGTNFLSFLRFPRKVSGYGIEWRGNKYGRRCVGALESVENVEKVEFMVTLSSLINSQNWKGCFASLCILLWSAVAGGWG